MRRVMPATDSASAVFCIRFYSARRRRITHSLLVVFIKKTWCHLISVMTPCQSFNPNVNPFSGFSTLFAAPSVSFAVLPLPAVPVPPAHDES